MFAWDCCRMCLSINNLNPITSLTEEDKFIKMIFNVSGVKIRSNDQLPKQLCKECTEIIENASKYREKCQETQKKLCNELKNRTICFKAETRHNHKHNECEHPETEMKQEEILLTNELFPTDVGNPHLCDNSPKLHTEPSNFIQKQDQNFVDINSIAYNQTIDNETPKQLIETKKTKVKLKTNLKIKNTKKKELKPPNKRLKNEFDVKIIKKLTESELLDNYDNDIGIREEVKCEHCNKILSSKTSIRNHMKIHTGFDIVCEHCGQKFLTKPRLLMHCKAKHGYEKTDKCSYCEYRGCNSEQVKIHERIHTGERPFVCKDCNASFLRMSCYLQHVAIHLPEKTVQCVQCPARFKSVTLMKIHANKHRMAQFSYKCYVCNSDFARRRNVLRHLRRIHAVSEPTQDIERVAK